MGLIEKLCGRKALKEEIARLKKEKASWKRVANRMAVYARRQTKRIKELERE